MVFNTQVILNLLVTVAGSIETAKQGSAILQASERVSRSLVVKPSATGSFPTFQPNMPVPSIAVGAGGSGAKATQPEQASQESEKSLSDQTGDNPQTAKSTTSADDASGETQRGTILRERNSDEPPNPKKRMWEESTTEPTESSGSKDEL